MSTLLPLQSPITLNSLKAPIAMLPYCFQCCPDADCFPVGGANPRLPIASFPKHERDCFDVCGHGEPNFKAGGSPLGFQSVEITDVIQKAVVPLLTHTDSLNPSVTTQPTLGRKRNSGHAPRGKRILPEHDKQILNG